MNTQTTTRLTRLQTSQRWLWVGPVAGLIAMAALFIWGATSGHPQVLVISGSVAAALAVMWATLSVSIKGSIAQELGQ